ncbi:MAG: NPCBM/NEW2 domain-containing protein [Oscillospiraceae bacterium]|nr:NPCBM/NEW2 domain-containing protein [Oscillospiraceae bacterium]
MKNKRFQKLGWILSGALIASLMFSLASPAIAALAGKTIEVYSGVNIYIDDVKLTPTDANGDPVDVFIYNGTTYLPVRAVSEALNQNVEWDGDTQSVFVGKHEADATPTMSLDNLDYFYLNDCTLSSKTVTDNVGNTHETMEISHHVSKQGSIVYQLNGQYSKLTGVYFLSYSSRSYTWSDTLTIYGDGAELWSGTVTAGVEPLDIDIDLTGILEMKIVATTSGNPNTWGTSNLGDTMLYS